MGSCASPCPDITRLRDGRARALRAEVGCRRRGCRRVLRRTADGARRLTADLNETEVIHAWGFTTWGAGRRRIGLTDIPGHSAPAYRSFIVDLIAGRGTGVAATLPDTGINIRGMVLQLITERSQSCAATRGSTAIDAGAAPRPARTVTGYRRRRAGGAEVLRRRT